MDKKSFLQAGHTPTLLAAFLYFDLAFMVWVILGPLGVGIAKDLGLSHAEKGLMVATPVLAGALLRIIMGVLVDRLSPKKAAIIGQVIVIAAMAYAWLFGVHSYAEVLILGVFLGVAGASFAAALPLASRWYPPSTRARRWALPAPATRAPHWPRCSRPAWRCLRVDQRLRHGADSAGHRAGGLLLHGQGRAGCAAAEDLGRIPEGAQGQGCLVVHVLLLGDFRRLRRPGFLAGHLLQHPIRP
jgi:hypothetical protein